MEKLKQIKNLNDLKEFLILNKESIKRAALPITVAAALLLFWILGGSDKEALKEDAGKDVSDITVEENKEPEEGENHESSDIYVDISGCVLNPGVYKVEAGTRLFQLIEKAGGITEDADIRELNRAEEVSDGQKVIIYSLNESQEVQHQGQSTEAGKVNINKADALELQTVPGIGPATAQKIIEYRQNNGRFNSLEDLKNVKGIGEKTFESMKEYITV